MPTNIKGREGFRHHPFVVHLIHQQPKALRQIEQGGAGGKVGLSGEQTLDQAGKFQLPPKGAGGCGQV